MDPLTQGTLGAALASAPADGRRLRAFAVAGAVGGLAPDLDIFISSATDPLLYLEFHRQFTHSLVFIPVGAALCALLVRWPLRRRLSWAETYLACLLGYATHGLLDACTSYGTQLFWPFSNMRVAWDVVSIVDPLLSVPLFGLVAFGVIYRQRWFAIIGLLWALSYLALGAVQHQRAWLAAQSLAAERSHLPERLSVKPAFGSLLLWKAIYEHDGAYFVDGIRIGRAPRVCDGEHVAKLQVPEQLPWLQRETQQWRDVERFRWFSDDWLAVDQEDPWYVVDVRYSALPNSIDALWGLKLNPDAPATRHAAFHVVRSRRTDELTDLFGLLVGDGCRALAH